jgi:hypothetical protein
MNNEQPEALRLANILQYKLPSIECLERAAAELSSLAWVTYYLPGEIKATGKYHSWNQVLTSC